jgi:hypothetical protein
MKLNTIKTISCSIKTDNSCSVQIYCIATYKIINTKETPKHRPLLLQKIMPDGCTMFRDPNRSQTNPVHTSTRFNGKHRILSHECISNRWKEKQTVQVSNHQNDKIHVN